MIVFLLLVIITILLFGSSVVLRGIGVILGFVALLFAVAVGISVAEQIPTWLWWTIGLVVGGGITTVFILDARRQAKLQRDLAAIRAYGSAEIARVEEDGRSQVDKVRRRSEIKFYNDGLNKKKRKQLARQDVVDHGARRKLLAPENRRMRMDLLANRPRNDRQG